MYFAQSTNWGHFTDQIEKLLGARTRTNNKLNPHMTPSLGIEPGHIGGRRVLSPLRHPCSPNK